ncbi:MAG: class I SAM-dependent methyltransferase [Alphaproteobacteria bacterium]|nr:class I SAM-dependent methyltransferase [Alphaproteobacteria bacterium]MBM4437395.1 class I SAM-dependent methyltransferase [Actinomycetota bacterium]
MNDLLKRLRDVGKRVPGASHLARTLRSARKYVRHVPHIWRGGADIFGGYYRSNHWNSEESRSGQGSSLAATEMLRGSLRELLRQLNVRSVLDVPCGDFNWFQHVDLGDIEYTGADVVRELVAENARLHARPGRRFLHADATKQTLPRADLVFCRDLFVHLPYSAIWHVLANLRASKSTYLLTTTFPDRTANANIITGMWRPLNLERAPFHFPPPMQLLEEQTFGPDLRKCMGLWRLAELPTAPRS